MHHLFPYLYDQRLKQHMCTFLTKTPVTKSLKNILDFVCYLNNFVDVLGSCSQVTASFLWTTILSVLVYRSYYLMISCDSLSSHFLFPWFYVRASNIVYPSRRIQEQLPSHLSSMYYSIYSDHKICLLLWIFYPLKLQNLRKCDFYMTFRRQCTKTQIQYIFLPKWLPENTDHINCCLSICHI